MLLALSVPAESPANALRIPLERAIDTLSEAKWRC